MRRTRMRAAGLAMLAAVCLLLAAIQASPLQSPAKSVAASAATASIAVYISLKSVNAVLSLAQEIEIGASAVASASLQPLKVLEPLDDTVERVAEALFWVSLLAWVLSLGIGPVSSLGFLLLAAGLLLHAARGPVDRYFRGLSPSLCRAGTAFNVTGLGLAIILPLSLTTGGMLAERLTRAQWEESQAVLTEVSNHSSDLLPGTEAVAGEADGDAAAGWFNWLPFAGSGTRGVLDEAAAYRDAATYYLERADDVLRASLIIVAIFLLRTLVLPLAVVVVLLALTRRLLRG